MNINKDNISVKPKLNSVEDMFNFYIKNLIKENPSYYLYNQGKRQNTQVLCYIGEELSYINKTIKARQLQLGETKSELNLNTDETKKFSLQSDISDLEVSIEALKAKKKSLESDKTKVKIIIDYKKFKEVITLYNTKAGKKIIEGKKVNLLSGLGYLGARIVERNHNKKTVNWGETNKLRDENGNLPLDKEGKKILVYFIDDDWLRVAWIKSSGIRNLSVYSFEPASGQPGKGYSFEFSNANKNNPTLRLKYDYFEYKPTVK